MRAFPSYNAGTILHHVFSGPRRGFKERYTSEASGIPSSFPFLVLPRGPGFDIQLESKE